MPDPIPTIPEFFQNKSILITGGSGFIGKILIEKLLRSCPALKTIYILMRPKRGKTVDERIAKITQLPLFDVLKSQNPGALSKLRLVEGDVTQLGLGLNLHDRQVLIDNVNIIFHGAASVRFDDPLGTAVLMNTRGTRELVLLALEIKNLDVLLHVSTTYCNTDRQVIGEQLYPPHADWRKTIEMAERVDKVTLDNMTKEYIAPLPNTYTFAKSLAEHVVVDLADGVLPVVVFRPSIVISTAKEPFPGWIDNFNGPVGLLIASGKGIVRSVYAKPDIIADYVPADLVVKALIISAWKKATSSSSERLTATFYNGSNNGHSPVTMGALVEMGKKATAELPLNNVLWYPQGGVTACYYYHLIRFFFYQLIPAVIIDGVLRLAGHKPLLVKIQRRIHSANMALIYFLTNQWTFVNDNSVNLENNLLEADFEAFSYDKNISVLEYLKNANLGARRYLLREDDASIGQAKKHFYRMWWVSTVFNVLWYLAIFWGVFGWFDLVGRVRELV